MTRRVGNVTLGEIELPSKIIPMIRTHAEWCTWLWTRGCLSVQHRKCRVNDHCVADDSSQSKAEESWRYQRRDVSR